MAGGQADTVYTCGFFLSGVRLKAPGMPQKNGEKIRNEIKK